MRRAVVMIYGEWYNVPRHASRQRRLTLTIWVRNSVPVLRRTLRGSAVGGHRLAIRLSFTGLGGRRGTHVQLGHLNDQLYKSSARPRFRQHFI